MTAGDGADVFLEFFEGAAVDGVVLPPAVFAGADEPAVRKHLHVMGQGGLGHLQFLQKPESALLPLGEHFNDSKSVGVGHCLADCC